MYQSPTSKLNAFILVAAAALCACAPIKPVCDPSTRVCYDCDLMRTDYPAEHPCFNESKQYQAELDKNRPSSTQSSSNNSVKGAGPEDWGKKGDDNKSTERSPSTGGRD